MLKISGFFSVAALAAGISLVGAGAAAAQGADLTVALASDVPSLDGSKDLSPIGSNLRLNIYDQLTEMLPDGSVGPRLATEWSTSEDGLAWTFTIADNAKFHDGSPVTADDVVWTFQKVMDDAKSPIKTYMSRVKSVEKTSDNQVRFNLTSPFAIFAKQVSIVAILPQKAYEAAGEAEFARKPVGSGPYVLVEHVKDDRLELKAFEDYWRGAPAIKSAVFRPIPAPLSRVAALQTGEVDLVPVLPPTAMDQLAQDPNLETHVAEGFRVMYLGFNTTLPPLGDVELRRAMDLAIDRETITSRLLRGLGTPSGQMFPPITFGYDPSIQPTKYDPAAAKEALARSNYKGEAIPLQYPNNNFAFADEVAQAIAGYLTEAGINVELQPMEFSAFLPAWANRKLTGMYFFAYGSSVYDADHVTAGIYESGSRIYEAVPEIDELAQAARESAEPAKRLESFARISQITKDQAIYLPLYVESQGYGVRKGVTWNPMPDGFVRLYAMELPVSGAKPAN